MALGSETIPSLIQGISQQDELARGAASAHAQENCFNEVLDGAVSRMGTRVVAGYSYAYADPFVHEINRDSTEQYLLIIEGTTLRVFNKTTGAECTLTGSAASYLSHTGVSRLAFQAVTVGDTTFFVNRQKVVEMATTKSAVRGNYAIAHFKAGGYKVKYKLAIRIGATRFETVYETPDNSAAANAEYITTDRLATEFRDALVDTLFPAMVTAGYSGFTVTRYGSVLIIYGGTHDFKISTTDGVGDKHFISFKAEVKTLTDLPTKCLNGYQVAVLPDGGQDSSKYFLKFDGDAEGNGRWEEVVAPDTETDLKASTMPHILVNTGPDEFTVGTATWGKRLAGDGDLTAQDPSYIGETIKGVAFLSGRLAIATPYTCSLSRSRNGYVFFPDTVQTNLDTAPIDYDTSNGNTEAIERLVVGGGKLQFWGDTVQTYLDSGQDPIRENTTEVLPLANYEFDGKVVPVSSGLSSVVFGTQVGNWSKVTEVYFRNGRPEGEIEVSAHVPRLLRGGLRHMTVGEASRKAIYLTDGEPTKAFVYQWYNQGSDRVQSAWNIWTFPGAEKVMWASIHRGTATFLIKWTTGCTIEVMTLDALGDEPDAGFPIRLDHRIDENWGTIDSETGYTFGIPYPVPVGKRSLFGLYEAEDTATTIRGRQVPITWLSTTSFKPTTPIMEGHYYFGSIPVARRTNTRFIARDRKDQPIIHDKLLIKDLLIYHQETVEYVVNVTVNGTLASARRFTARELSMPGILNNKPPFHTGTFKVDVGEETEAVEIELVNDTVFPGNWKAMRVNYDLTTRG